MRSRVDDELAVRAQYAFTARERMLDELGNGQVLPQLSDLEFLRNRKNDGPSS